LTKVALGFGLQGRPEAIGDEELDEAEGEEAL